jgi:hypothetical protein
MPHAPISIDLSSSDADITRLERHSYVNLINVVHAELQLVERMLDAPGSLRSAIHLAEAASRAFKESRVARRHLGELATFGALVESDLQETLDAAGDAAEDRDVREACAILRDVLPDADLRVHEVVARHRLPWPEHEHTSSELTDRISRHGVETMIDSTSPTVRLPVGIPRAIEAMVGGSNGQARIDRVVLHQADLTTIMVSGSSSVEYLDALTARLRPSELHAVLAGRGEPLRGAILLAYYTIPDGDARLTTGDNGEFTIDAVLSQPAPVDERTD